MRDELKTSRCITGLQVCRHPVMMLRRLLRLCAGAVTVANNPSHTSLVQRRCPRSIANELVHCCELSPELLPVRFCRHRPHLRVATADLATSPKKLLLLIRRSQDNYLHPVHCAHRQHSANSSHQDNQVIIIYESKPKPRRSSKRSHRLRLPVRSS